MVFSERVDGSFAIDGEVDALAMRRSKLLDGPWTALHQVHGATVFHVTEPGEHLLADGDALVSDTEDVVLGVQTADCVPVLLVSRSGAAVIGAAHGGWRGLYDGVIEATVNAMRALGADDIAAFIGPCIGAASYEFGERDLTAMALRFGPDVIAATDADTPGLDVVTATTIALRTVGVDDVTTDAALCTATSLDGEGAPRFFSHRARADVGRQASAISFRR